jgi:putative hydrolase of the HAD superfamily
MYLFSGVEATLHSLAARGYQMALITNGDSEIQRHKINRFQLGQHFRLILVEGEVGFGKPDQRIYEEALANLKVEPQETWMIGDNLDWDIAGPQALGIKGIWYDWKGKGLPINGAVIPYRTILTIGDLLEILE